MGAHNLILHPLLVWIAWGKLYGYTLSPYRIVQFIVHDWGYWGRIDIDGDSGKDHPYLGAKIVSFLFDWGPNRKKYAIGDGILRLGPRGVETLFHSRYMTRRHPEIWGMEGALHGHYYKFTAQWKLYGASSRRDITRLCAADKLAFCLSIEWMYKFMAVVSGEDKEYCKGYVNFDDCYRDFWWQNWSTVIKHIANSELSMRKRKASLYLLSLETKRKKQCWE